MHTPIAVGRLSGVLKISHNIDLTCSIIPDVIAKEDVYLDINGPIIRWHLLKFYGISQINDLTVRRTGFTTYVRHLNFTEPLHLCLT